MTRARILPAALMRRATTVLACKPFFVENARLRRTIEAVIAGRVGTVALQKIAPRRARPQNIGNPVQNSEAVRGKPAACSPAMERRSPISCQTSQRVLSRFSFHNLGSNPRSERNQVMGTEPNRVALIICFRGGPKAARDSGGRSAKHGFENESDDRSEHATPDKSGSDLWITLP